MDGRQHHFPKAFKAVSILQLFELGLGGVLGAAGYCTMGFMKGLDSA